MSIKRYVIVGISGVAVFGAVTAFAATLTVNSKSLGSGNATVASCNSSAAVSYTTAYSASLPGYTVATAPITTAAGCGSMSYKVTLTGASNASLAEATGTLATDGTAAPTFTGISAALVTGVSVVITG